MSSTSRRVWAGILAAVLLVLAAPSAHAQALFRATLTTDQEPHDVTGSSSGTAAVYLTGDEVEFVVTVDGLTGPVTGAHFHRAGMGGSGGVVRAITSDFSGPTAAGVWRATDSQPLTSELIDALLAGELYVNVHTAANPAGEIRGQVLLDAATLLTGHLTSSQETHDVTSEASGTAAAWVTERAVIYRVTVDGLSGPITAAHFHAGAAGVSGGAVRTITGDFSGQTAFGIWTPEDGQPLTGELMGALLMGRVYLNVHTAANPAGEVRGQLIPSTGWVFGAALDASQETQAVSSTARGTLTATLLGPAFAFSLTVEGLEGNLTAAHFHAGAPGVDGSPVHTITSDFDGNTASGIWSFDGVEPLSPELVQALLEGNLYVNVHTTAHPTGEIRGQLGLTSGVGLRATLTPEQERHEVIQAASGTAHLELTPEGLLFNVSVSGLSGGITGAHFHSGSMGENGGVLRTITGDFTDGTATGVWKDTDGEPLTAAAIADLMTGGVYLNVHTAANPAGEIRGQVVLGGGSGLGAALTPGQVSDAVTSDGRGTASLVFTPAGVAYALTVAELSGNVANAHFHVGRAGVNGGPARGILAEFSGNSARGFWSTTDAEPLTRERIADLLTGGLYLNIHTAAYPAGEIRGQVLPVGQVTMYARMDADQEVQNVTSSATGTAVVGLSPSGSRFDVTVAGLSGPMTGAHFHRAPRGTNGGVARTITGDFFGNTATGVWRPNDTEPLTTDRMLALAFEQLYLNVHTAAYPSGEIRGQIEEAASLDINVSIERIGNGDVPGRISLEEAFPNPFNPSTTIEFSLGTAGEARLDLVDMLGRHVATLSDGSFAAGVYRVRLDADGLPSGVYLVSLTAGVETRVRRVVLVK